MDNERLTRVEEQLKWIGPRIERIEIKIDNLLEFKWKIYGATALIAFVITSIVEVFARR